MQAPCKAQRTPTLVEEPIAPGHLEQSQIGERRVDARRGRSDRI